MISPIENGAADRPSLAPLIAALAFFSIASAAGTPAVATAASREPVSFTLSSIKVRRRRHGHNRIGAAMDLVEPLIHVQHAEEAAWPVKAAVFWVHRQAREAEVALH